MNNKILLVFSILIALTLLPFPVGALTYDYTNDNGSWIQYTSGLSSDYYATDSYFNTYDRGFESISTSDFVDSCSGEWCSDKDVLYSSPTYEIKGTGEDFDQGNRSLLLYSSWSNDQVRLTAWAKDEVLSDSNVSFSYKFVRTGNIDNTLDFGYVNDSNTFTYIERISASDSTSGWVDSSINLTGGSPKRFAVRTTTGSSSSTGTAKLYVDNVTIVKNNTGTFRTSDPQYCNSINSCSNIEEYLKSNELNGTYWVVDYVAGASCVWAKNGSIQSTDMIEGTNGMYYVAIDEDVESGNYEDVNLLANCILSPFTEKSFAVNPTLYRYGLLSGGSFESETTSNINDSCSDYFCGDYRVLSGTTTSSVVGSSDYYVDAQKSLKISITGTGSTDLEQTIWAKDETSGGDTIFIKYLLDSYVERYSSGSKLYFGYVNDSNNFTQVGDYVDINDFPKKVWYDRNITIPTGDLRYSFRVRGGNADFITYFEVISSSGAKQESSLTTDNNLTSNYGLRGTTYLFTSDYVNSAEYSITTADCNVTINSTDYDMAYNSTTGKYEYSTAFVSDGTYTIATSCEDDSFNSQEDSYSIDVISPASTILTFNNLVNISSVVISDFSNDVNFLINDKTKGIGWSIVAQEDSYEVQYNFLNSLLESSQYYVYTSSNGSDWTFSDSLTYGSGDYNSAMQKVRVNDDYSYGFNDSDVASGVKKYFKLEYRGVARYWETIRFSSDWINVNSPELSIDSDGKNWDLFSDSNYSNVSSYTSLQYPDLTSTDLNTGLEFQFTAYASRETTLKIGFENEDGSGSTYTIYVGTGKQKYSVAIDATDRTSRLVIQSDETSEARVYLTDYILIPKSYFVNRLEFRNTDGSKLGAIGISGTSYQILKEGIAFKFTSSAFDINGNLATLRIEALLNATTAKTFEFDLSEDVSPSTYYNWSETLSGVIDLNGWYADPATLRDLTLKATLIDDSGNEVAEQSSTIKLLQYPYFADDIQLNLFNVGSKVGDNPVFRFDLEQKLPDNFLGFKVFIYDENHSRTSPNYEDIVFEKDFDCGFYCSKELVVPDWVWEKQTLYNIDLMLLVNTENENYSNDLLYRQFTLRPTYRTLETARILQIYERTDEIYRNDEPIPLVLQLRDVPYKDLSKDFSVYLNIDLCNDANVLATCYDEGTTKFNPIKHIYDQSTGYNYYYFNNLFYTDEGSLLPDGNYIRFQAILDEKNSSHETGVIPTLTDKCALSSYGTLFLNGSFSMNLTDYYDATTRALYGCTTTSPAVVEVADSNEARILIGATHATLSNQNHSLHCVNADNNNNYVNNLEQDLICSILFTKSEQEIDTFTAYIGNENSDYSEDELIGQYLRFDIPSEYIIFNDPVFLSKALDTEYQTDSIDNVGEVLYYNFDKLFSGIANPLTDVLTGIGVATGLISNQNADVNWDRKFDPNYISGIFTFKVKGIKVINQYDYTAQFPELEVQDPKFFSKWASNNNVFIPEQRTIVEVYSNDGQPIIREKTSSNIVIFKAPSASTKSITATDGNLTSHTIASRLKFDVVLDMLSNNETSISRIFVPLTLNYVVPDNTNPLTAILSVGGEFIQNPITAGLKYWFWFVIVLLFILIVSVIFRNLKGGGTTIINEVK